VAKGALLIIAYLLAPLAVMVPFALAEMPKKLLADVKQSRIDALPAVEEYLKSVKTYKFERDELLQNILIRLERGGDVQRLPAVIDQLLDDEATNGQLEQILRLLYMAKRWKKKEAVPGYEEFVDKIAALAQDDKSHNVRRLLQYIYEDDFPQKLSKRKATSEEIGVQALGSTYTDEATGELRKEVGTGSIVEIPDLDQNHSYLITAGHLVGGANPFVTVNGKNIPVTPDDIINDNGRDLSMVRIPKSAGGTPAFILDRYTVKPSPGFMDQLRANEIPLRPVFAGEAITLENMKFNADFKKEYGGNYHKMLLGEITHYSTYQAPWAQANTRESTSSDLARSGTPELVSRGETIHAQFESTPGMSGTFLLEESVNDGTTVKGILTQYNYYFRDSYFTEMSQFGSLVKAFKAGSRGNLTTTHWRMKNGLTYRVFRDGYEEANFLDFPAGNGVSGDPGNGVHGDPGNGTHGDPGNGVLGDPGAGTHAEAGYDDLHCTEAELADGNFKNIAELQAALLKGIESSPEEVFTKYGIRPGMKYKGQSIIGIKAVPKADPAGAFLLYANPTAAQFMSESEKDYTFEPVPEGASLAEFALAKAKYAFKGTPSKLVGGDEARLKATTPYYDYGDIKITKDGVNMEFILDYGHDEPPTSRYSLDMKLTGGARPDKFIPIKLDAQGRLPGEKNFLPIVEVKDKLGVPFRVDLRQLYFTDLSQVAQEFDRYHQTGLPRTADEALEQSREVIQIPYRNVQTGRETAVTLLPRDCSLDSKSGNWYSRGKYTRSKCLELSDEWK
jgi:hypothetical protein